jgi:tetratricopeptide (TPR) repeat protein
MAEAADNPDLTALRESLRKVDTILNFARRLARDQGDVPPGLIADFSEARKELEREFVFRFKAIDAARQKDFRDFLQHTKNLSPKALAKGVSKLSLMARTLLNSMVIDGDEGVSLTEELTHEGIDRATQLKAAPEPAESPAAAAPQFDVKVTGGGARPSSRLARTLAVLTLLGALGGVGLFVAFSLGAFSGTEPPPQNTPHIAANTSPDNRPPANAPVQPDTPFDAAAAGYAGTLALRPIQPLNPLDTELESLNPGSLPGLLLGIEQLILLIEPERLKFSPNETRARLDSFSRSAFDAEPAWRESRVRFLEAFLEHVRIELALARYPDEAAAGNVLVSDVLHAAGGPQLSLCMTLQVLAHGCNAPLRLVAPNGHARPLLAIALPDGLHTWNGTDFGLRGGSVTGAAVTELMHELLRLLRPTMATPAGRSLATAMLLHFAGKLEVEQARQVLPDLDPAWLQKPAETAPEDRHLLHRVAGMLQPVVCRLLLAPGVTGTSDEALLAYRLSAAAGDESSTQESLLRLGERAQPGTMLDGKPLSIAVGELLQAQGRAQDAQTWFERALTEHPDDPRPALRLAERAEGERRFSLFREAYARGDRSRPLLRQLAAAAAANDDGLLALAMLDELCAGADPEAADLEAAALQCISLERADWALERLARHYKLVEASPALQRLDLLCELSVHGMSERAAGLASAWRARGEKDEYLEGVLKRFGR